MASPPLASEWNSLPPEGQDWGDVLPPYEEWYDQYKLDLANQYGSIELPDVQLIRPTTIEDWAPTLASCIRDEGWNVVATTEPAVELVGGLPDASQIDAYNLAWYICQVQYPMPPAMTVQLPRVRAEEQFDYLIETQVPCLEGLGYTISDPPSKEVWLSDFYGGDGRYWWPYDQVVSGDMTPDTLNDQCPQFKPGIYADQG